MFFQSLMEMQLLSSKREKEWSCWEFNLDKNVVVYYFKCAKVKQFSDMLKKYHAIQKFKYYVFYTHSSSWLERHLIAISQIHR